jgi:hypothetical protein
MAVTYPPGPLPKTITLKSLIFIVFDFQISKAKIQNQTEVNQIPI